MERSFLTINRRTTGVAIGILVGAGSIALWASNTELSDSGSSIGDSVANIASLLDARSPGERTKAELSKTKRSSDAASSLAEPADLVTERVLGKVFSPATNDHLVITPEELMALTPLGVPLAQFPDGDVAPRAPTFLGGPLPVSGGGLGPGFISGGSSSGGGNGGGGSSGGGGEGQPPAPPEQIPAVPEPSAWVLMLMGAAMCGASMRRQRRLQRQAIA
ncbi:PEP-CTERM sorting domain-containing protein [Erythrobacter sp. QSSC1-22B]|uniref:PEP-CTERM sorting domain-containing protein n=1 Tax=Erythrobacter sp. QSSC1-22B TaxID=1860125 RepID=UPI0009F37808